ncbi:MAG TPA: PilZ domain-containing protein [Polyangiaceae bacterium]|jgi:DNA-binding response OmpR family regulator|nr:PilZ domain-containing protein [Polyangiaceae bacterium]
MAPPAERPLLVLGSYGREDRARLSSAASQAAFSADFVDNAREASRWLDAHDAHAVVIDDGDVAKSVCLEARAQAKHAQVPMLSLNSGVDDLSFADAFSWGGDDAVERRDTHALVSRLRALPLLLPGLPRNGRGVALIVDSDRARRIVLGRVLRNAGYSIEFAVSDQDAIARARDASPKLVVASSDVGESPAALLTSARNVGATATWIVTCPPKDIGAARAAVESLGNATVTDGFAPAENVVFLANELERGGANDKRASRRLLYGTAVAFRGAGRDSDDRGFSYNISVGGLYVRTLSPPEDDIVWVELRPPRSERRVRLEGRVVWRRKFGSSEGATVPPGFGVAISDATKRDVDAWRDGYGAFAHMLGYSSASLSPRG